LQEGRSARNREMSDGFKRQRRNLLIASIFIAIFFSSGARIEKLNLLGTTIEIDNPAIANYFIILMFCYFIIRFWQYYIEEAFVKNSYNKLRNYFYTWEYSYLRLQATKRITEIKQLQIYTMVPNASRNIGITWTSIPQKKDTKVSLFRKKAYIYASLESSHIVDQEKIDGNASDLFHENMINSKDWKVVTNSTDKKPIIYETGIDYSVIRFHLMRLRGIILYSMNESYFTDYQLPIVIAFFATLLAILI